jgi:hypothetical protein
MAPWGRLPDGGRGIDHSLPEGSPAPGCASHLPTIPLSAQLTFSRNSVEIQGLHRIEGGRDTIKPSKRQYIRSRNRDFMDRQDVRERLGNIDQIRDILVGSQLRDYENRFAQIESEVNLLHQDLQDRIEEVKSSLSSQLQASLEALDKRLKAFTTKMQEETTDLQQQNDRLGRRLQSTFEELDRAFEDKTSAIDGRLSESRDKLQEDLRTLRSQIFEELEGRISALHDNKLERESMAEMLFELGMRLKGQDVVPALQAAIDPPSALSVELIAPEG